MWALPLYSCPADVLSTLDSPAMPKFLAIPRGVMRVEGAG